MGRFSFYKVLEGDYAGKTIFAENIGYQKYPNEFHGMSTAKINSALKEPNRASGIWCHTYSVLLNHKHYGKVEGDVVNHGNFIDLVTALDGDNWPITEGDLVFYPLKGRVSVGTVTKVFDTLNICSNSGYYRKITVKDSKTRKSVTLNPNKVLLNTGKKYD